MVDGKKGRSDVAKSTEILLQKRKEEQDKQRPSSDRTKESATSPKKRL